RLGLPRVDVAVAAGARAGVAEDLEGGRAAAPALGDVRAACLLANRVQARSVDELANVVVVAVRARRADLHPLRSARPLGDWKRALHRTASLVTGAETPSAARRRRPAPVARARASPAPQSLRGAGEAAEQPEEAERDAVHEESRYPSGHDGLLSLDAGYVPGRYRAEARRACTGCSQRPPPPSAGSCSKRRSKTSSSAAAASGLTSSTVTGRPA